MKKIILSLFTLMVTGVTFCQSSGLKKINDKRARINKTGFAVLGGWSAANIIYGSIATSGATGSNKYFNQMNAIWGGVNLGLSVMGLLAARKDIGPEYYNSLKKQASLEKTFILNAGLDLAYISTGLYLREKSRNVTKNPEKLKGYGESVILQGGGLLIFDAVMFSLHNANGKKLFKLAEKIQLTSSGSSVGVLVKL